MKKPGRYQFSGVGSHRANAWGPGGGWHLSIAPTPLRGYRFAVKQDARRATAAQSGEMKGEAPLLHFTRHRNVDRLLNR